MIKLHHDNYLNIIKDIPNDSIDAIITDPPYGILNHKMDIKVDIEILFKECYRILKQNSFLVFFGRQPTLTEWNRVAFEYFKYKQEIIWYKRQNTSPMDDIGRVFENITVVMKGYKKFNTVYRNYCDVKQSLAEFAEWDSIYSQINMLTTPFRDQMTYEDALDYINNPKDKKHYYKDHIQNSDGTIRDNLSDIKTFKKTLKTHINGLRPQNLIAVNELYNDNLYNYKKSNDNNVINNKICRGKRYTEALKTHINGLRAQNLVSFLPHNKKHINGTQDSNIKHPTVKSIELMEYLIELCSNKDDIIVDMFMGSGTTGIAALNTNRNFIGIEINKDYFEIAQSRIQQKGNKQYELLPNKNI